MTCAQRTDSIFLYIADELEPAEADDLRAHLATGCPVCHAALAEAEATVAMMASAVEPVAPPASARLRVMSHARTESRARQIQQYSVWRTAGAAALAAALAVAVTTLILYRLTEPARRFFHSHDLQTVSLTSQTQPKARGQVLWDRQTGQWRLAVFNLAPPAPGREYELWFITPDGQKIPSKTFNVDDKGQAMLMVEVPKDIGPIALTAITDEPAGGVSQPTGQIHLVGQVPALN